MTILIQKTIPKLCALSSIMQRPLSQVQSGAYLKTKYLPLCFLPPYQIWYFFKLSLSYLIAKKLSSEMVIQHILQMSTVLIREDEISMVLSSFIIFVLCDIFRKFTTRILAYSNIDLEMMQPLHFISQLISFSAILQ